VRRTGTLVRVAAVPLAFIAGCGLIASATGTDPMLAVELAALALMAAWLVLFGRGVRRARADAERLADVSRPIGLAGADVRLVDASQPAAFVSGLVRPQIYLSRSLIDSLDAAELRGVLLHEQHHRRTRAPLRALALESWQRLLGWLPPARRALAARLAGLEIEADAAAVARGTAPATLASALLKCEAHPPGPSSAFAAASEIRIGELVAWGGQQHVDRHFSIPVEWVAPAGAAIALWACHVVGA
jgi:Zn-dependent protease with chaperone function